VTRRVVWPDRGPTWLAVPALIVAVCGAIILLGFLPRQNLSRELLESGAFAIAETTQVDVANSEAGAVRVGFYTTEGRLFETPLADYESGAAASRYAAPLQIVYMQTAPQQALALVDAEHWSADRTTPRVGTGMLAGGLLVILVVTAPYLRRAYHRALMRWRWYVERPYLTHPNGPE
jgi:hypothetical protein